jgi:hypothetical protein
MLTGETECRMGSRGAAEPRRTWGRERMVRVGGTLPRRATAQCFDCCRVRVRVRVRISMLSVATDPSMTDHRLLRLSLALYTCSVRVRTGKAVRDADEIDAYDG